MNYKVKAGNRTGKVAIPASKSYAHRQLICAALSKTPTTIKCEGFSKDIVATAECLRALGADIVMQDDIIKVNPITNINKESIILPCNESGSTLRFLLPVVAALGVTATFEMAGGLAKRPVDELTNVMKEHGVTIEKGINTISVNGKMNPGEYIIPGNVSSQYISGLLFALPLLEGDSTLLISGTIESQGYIKITEDSLVKAGIVINKTESGYLISGNQTYSTKANTYVEQDWSGAAFFLCMGAMSPKGITVNEMPLESNQGDKEIMDVLKKFGANIDIKGNSITVRKGELKGISVDASKIPDLVPTIAALAALSDGTTNIYNAHRLRIKESDRLKTTTMMLQKLGAKVDEMEDGLVIEGKDQLFGGTIDACNDHRIAMAAAVAACGCKEEVIVLGSECIDKSFPGFWEQMEGLEVLNE